MSDTILLEVQAPEIPADFCPSGTSQQQWQQVADALLLGARFSIPVNSRFVNFGPTTPSADFQAYPWFNTTTGRWYFVGLGYWLSLHEDASKVSGSYGHTIIAPPGIVTQADVDAYEGGEAGVPSAATGPFWRIDPDFIGRFPLGAGLVPGSDPALTVDVGDQGGSGSHVLLQTELPATINLVANLAGHRFNPETLAPLALAPRGSGGAFATTPAFEDGSFSFVNAGGATPMSLMPPYTGRLLLQKTARIYYRLPL